MGLIEQDNPISLYQMLAYFSKSFQKYTLRLNLSYLFMTFFKYAITGYRLFLVKHSFVSLGKTK